MYNELRRLKRENDRQMAALDVDSRAAIRQAASYMSLARAGALDRELIRRDLITMALEAEQRGEPFSAVIDDDRKVWCDDISASVGGARPLEHYLVLVRFFSGFGAYLCLLLYGTFLAAGRSDATISAVPLLILMVLAVPLRLWEMYIAPRFTFHTAVNVVAFLFYVLPVLIFFASMRNFMGSWVESSFLPVPVGWLGGGLLIIFCVSAVAYRVYIHLQVKERGVVL